MTGVDLSAFFDEFTKIAKSLMTDAFMKSVARSTGEAGKRLVPKSVPKTLKIGPGGVKRLPHVSTLKAAA